MGLVAIYYAVDQQTVDRLRAGDNISGWLEEVVEGGKLPETDLDKEWYGLHLALNRVAQAEITPELPYAATGIEQVYDDTPVLLITADIVKKLAGALKEVDPDELYAAGEAICEEDASVLLSNPVIALEGLQEFYQEAANADKNIAVVIT